MQLVPKYDEGDDRRHAEHNPRRPLAVNFVLDSEIAARADSAEAARRRRAQHRAVGVTRKLVDFVLF